ncbi:hypothetical protein [Dokdonella sp.]|uniref:hypothetical protein n=1 Tax=Dokdonella sp. TaxID=2291710 RepID=UPI002F41936D
MPAVARATAAAALVWTGVIACAAGLVLHRLWLALTWNRCVDGLVLALVSFGLATLLRRVRAMSLATAFACVWAAALVWFAGVLPVLAVALVGAGACALGGLLLGDDDDALLALAVGLVVIGGLAGWTLQWPIHRAWVYVPLLVAACILRSAALRRGFVAVRAGWRTAVAESPRLAAVAMLALGLASVGAWLPTMQADDLAYHLGLPSQLQRHAAYAADPEQQIWALAPWLGDVLQAIAQVIARREARGALDALWLLVVAGAVWRLARRVGADVAAAWLTLALCASLPLLAALLGSMHTELPATALLLACALAIVDARGDRLLAGAALCAGLVALKFGSAVSALVLVVWALARARGRVDWTRMPVALVLFAALAGSNYAFAWQATGNPLFPLFNQVFASPLLPPTQLADPRWHAGFGFALPWSITFDTDRYLEAADGGFGFVLVALGGAWLLALARRETRALALVASVVLLLPLLPMQYARYAFPGLVLLLPALVVAAARSLGARGAACVVLATCALDVAFQANGTWLLQVNTLRKLAGNMDGASEALRRYAPERTLIAELRRRDDGDSVVLALDPQAPYIAELARRGRSVSHYAPALERARMAADASGDDAGWQALIRGVDARWLLLRPEHLGDAQRAALAALGARRVATAGAAELWSVDASRGAP